MPVPTQATDVDTDYVGELGESLLPSSQVV